MKGLRYVLLLGMLLSGFALPAGVRGDTVINDMVIMPCECSGCTTCLPKTGQEVCYDVGGSTINCTTGGLNGQDAMYADPGGSYDYGCTKGEGSWATWGR